MYLSLITFSDIIGLNLALTVAAEGAEDSSALVLFSSAFKRLSDAGSVHPGGSDSGNMTSFT